MQQFEVLYLIRKGEQCYPHRVLVLTESYDKAIEWALNDAVEGFVSEILTVRLGDMLVYTGASLTEHGVIDPKRTAVERSSVWL